MLRDFLLKAHAAPNDLDAFAVHPDLAKVRTFVSGLSPVPIITMMAFFEDFIQKFMPYLARLADLQGSEEQQYTQVHSACDAQHSQELFRALEAELALEPCPDKLGRNSYRGVYLLRRLEIARIDPRQRAMIRRFSWDRVCRTACDVRVSRWALPKCC